MFRQSILLPGTMQEKVDIILEDVNNGDVNIAKIYGYKAIIDDYVKEINSINRNLLFSVHNTNLIELIVELDIRILEHELIEREYEMVRYD